MKKKPVSSILFFSLLTLVAHNNVKTAELQSIRGFLAKAMMYNDALEEKEVLRDSTTQKNQLEETAEELIETKKKLKKADIKLMDSRSLLTQYKSLGNLSEIELALTKLAYLEAPDNEAEEEYTQLVYDVKQLKDDVNQLKKENLVIRRILENNLKETEQDNSVLSKKYPSLPLKHKHVETGYQKLDTEIEKQD